MIKISRLSKHLGNGEPLVIDGEEFVLKPLGTEALPLFFKVMKAFSGAKEGASTEDMLSNVDDDGLNAIRKLIDDTLTASLPDESLEERQQFGLKYMNVLLNKIMELNSADTTDDNKRKSEFLEKVKKKQDGLAPKPEIEN